MKLLARQAVAAVAVGTRLWPIVRPGHAVVLRYHRVAGTAEEPVPLAVTPEEFEGQLRFLKARCRVVRPSEVARAIAEGRPLPRNTVAITFDDGYEDNATAALPLLQKHGLAAAFFVTAGWIGTDRMMWWDTLHEVVLQAAEERRTVCGPCGDVLRAVASALAAADLSEPAGRQQVEQELVGALRSLNRPADELGVLVGRLARALALPEPGLEGYRPMTWEQVRQLRAAGMEIGSHLMTHARLATLPEKQAHDELAHSKQAIEEHLGEPIGSLAYPAGSYNDGVVAAAAEVGYTAGFTTDTGPVRPGDPPLALRRIGVWGGGYRGAASHFSPSVFGLQIGRLARSR